MTEVVDKTVDDDSGYAGSDVSSARTDSLQFTQFDNTNTVTFIICFRSIFNNTTIGNARTNMAIL